MTDSVYFLKSIHETPRAERIVPSLVYCDWLEENSYHAEAEVLRLMIERAGTRLIDPKWQELTEKINTMLASPIDQGLFPYLPTAFSRSANDLWD